MKKIIRYFCIAVLGLLAINNVNAKEISYINLDNFEYSSGNGYTTIKEYDSLDSFKEDYNSNSLPDIYITNFLFDGVSAVKTPDLDDFIEANSNDTKVKTLEIKVVNINTTGDIELTGTTVGTMIAVNTNNVKEDINIILNNVNIDTDSKKAPAIYIYNKDVNYTDCKVTIKTKANTKNYLEGGKLKKVSLIGSDELDSYSKYYSGDSLNNYTNYSNYYGIYTKEEINNILFATVTADSEDLADGDPYYFYKGSGAISSDIDLYFNGEGYLKVTSKNKEGIETKGNLTFSGGVGDYEISAYDDCLNTTTAGTNARNNMTIEVNSLIAIVNDEGDEGDAIDSNGKLTINGGTVYAFAHSSSQDSGLDSGTGTYINNATILATGNMMDQIDTDQKYIYVSLNSKVSKDTLIVIKDEDDNIINAFKTTKDITTLLYTSKDLDYESFKIYTGGEITGEEENGVYTKIEDYTNGEELSYSASSMNMKKDFNINNNSNNFILIMLIVEIILLAITCAIAFIFNKRKNNSE